MPDNDVALQRSKAALVLAGGGVTGAFYEIGALCALDEQLPALGANGFDLYVGTSAGALVGACLANGITPRNMLRQADASDRGATPLRIGDIFTLDRGGVLGRGLRLPGALAGAIRTLMSKREHTSLLDAIEALADALPSGLYDSAALERYLGAVLTLPGCTNDFRALRRELAIIATDLDTGERAVFGAPPLDETPIARAVAASSAVPLIYQPVSIGGRDYIDGGIRGTASLDVAIERGARLIVCVNPQTPLDARRLEGRGGYIRRLGAKGIVNQTVRTFVHAGLHYHLKQIRRHHPEIDIILIEPARDDERMFSEMPMRYAARLSIAQHGYETVSRRLAEHSDEHQALLARHGFGAGQPAPPEDAGTGDGNSALPFGEAHRLRSTLTVLERVLTSMFD